VKRAVLFLVLAACARSNQGLLDELERRARAEPDPEALALLDGKEHRVPLVREPRTISLPLGSGSMPTVTGRVNGVEIPLVLDTGSSIPMLSGPAARAARLYVPPADPVRMMSPGFDARYRLGVFDTLSLGELEFGQGVASVPLREASSSRGAYGIVGCSVLGHFRVTFDFKARRVHLEPHRRPSTHRPLFTDVRIGGRSFLMLIDSGATRVFLEPWAARELGLISEADASRHAQKSESFRGGRRRATLRLETLEVGGRTFRDVRAGVVHTFGEERSDRGVRPGGLLGLAGLGEHSWTLDFAAKTLTVRVEE
jgi:hypothetical protein